MIDEVSDIIGKRLSSRRVRIVALVALVLMVSTGGCLNGVSSGDGGQSETGNESVDEETYSLTIDVEREDGGAETEIPAHISLWQDDERVIEERYGSSVEFHSLENGTYQLHVLTDDKNWTDGLMYVTIDGENKTVTFETERTGNGSPGEKTHHTATFDRFDPQ